MREKTAIAARWSVVICATIFFTPIWRALAKACSVSSRPRCLPRIDSETSTRSSATWRLQESPSRPTVAAPTTSSSRSARTVA